MVKASDIARAGASQAVAGGRFASRGIAAAHSELPLPQPPAWAGYWTFVTGTILLAFVLYTAQKGTLATWVNLFVGPGAPSTGQSATGTASTPVGTVLGVPGVTTLSPGASGIVSGAGGTQVLNPGAPFNFGSVLSGITGMFSGKPSTGN